MTPHVSPCITVAEGDDSTQYMLKREKKVIKQFSPLNLLCCYCSRVGKTFIFSKENILMFIYL